MVLVIAYRISCKNFPLHFSFCDTKSIYFLYIEKWFYPTIISDTRGKVDFQVVYLKKKNKELENMTGFRMKCVFPNFSAIKFKKIYICKNFLKLAFNYLTQIVYKNI